MVKLSKGHQNKLMTELVKLLLYKIYIIFGYTKYTFLHTRVKHQSLWTSYKNCAEYMFRLVKNVKENNKKNNNNKSTQPFEPIKYYKLPNTKKFCKFSHELSTNQTQNVIFYRILH